MAGGGYDGAVIGVGCAFYLADGFYLIVIGVAGVGLVVGVIKICGGAEEGIGAVFSAAAVHLILAGPGDGGPLDVGLAGRDQVVRRHHGSRAVAGACHGSAVDALGADSIHRLDLVIIDIAGVGLAVGVFKICGGAEEGIGAVFGAAAVYLIFDLSLIHI